MSIKVEKVHNFLDPSPRMLWTFLNLRKIGSFDAPPPPSDLIWEKFEIGKIFNLGTPPPKKKHKLKTLKIAKKSL